MTYTPADVSNSDFCTRETCVRGLSLVVFGCCAGRQMFHPVISHTFIYSIIVGLHVLWRSLGVLSLRESVSVHESASLHTRYRDVTLIKAEETPTVSQKTWVDPGDVNSELGCCHAMLGSVISMLQNVAQYMSSFVEFSRTTKTSHHTYSNRYVGSDIINCTDCIYKYIPPKLISTLSYTFTISGS